MSGLAGWNANLRAGLQFEEQVRKNQQSQRALEAWLNMTIASFTSPWNTYNQQTIRTLNAGNSRALSGSLGIACKGEAVALVYFPPHLRWLPILPRFL